MKYISYKCDDDFSKYLKQVDTVNDTLLYKLAAYYKFDEGSGGTTADATAHGFDGTLVNSMSWMVPSTSPAPAYMGYAWSNGNTMPQITAVAAGIYSLTVTNTNGCQATASLEVTVNPVPGAAGMITGPVVTGQGHSGISYSVAPVANATGYNWSLPPGATIASGANTGSITVNFSPGATSGTISVYAVNDCGSGALSPELTVTVLPVNFNPGTTIVQAGTSHCYDALQTIYIAGGGALFTVASGGSATMIAGHSISYLPGTHALHGAYMHGYITTNNQYCGGMAPAMVTVVTGDEPVPDVSASHAFRVYPNPTTGNFTVEPVGDPTPGQVRVDVLNINGVKVLSEEITWEGKHLFSISTRPPGIYFIHILSGDRTETVKLIKL